jgi:DNA primase small subunit
MHYNRREISFIVRQEDGEEFCLRNMSYSDADKFKSDIRKYVPARIDIGPIYDNNAYNNKDATKKGTAVAREFVIDIDMNDYNDIRTCCTGKSLCQKCWKFLVAAYEVLKEILEKSLGFKSILWVFSGRRGIHAWVSDKAAKNMSGPIRKSLTEYLNFTINNDKLDSLVKPGLISKKVYPPLEYSNQARL